MKFKKLTAPVLAIVLTAGILLGVRFGLSGIAEKKARAELENTISFLLPESTTFTREDCDGGEEAITAVYKGETGYVIQAAAQGYAGEITVMVGVDNSGQVTGLTVRNLEETWGLGARALTDTEFLIQFLGTEGGARIGGGIDALTGATVTSKAIARAVNAAVGYVTGADASSGATSWGG